MKMPRSLFLGARLCFGLFCLATSIYCLLAYIPFTYYHFLQFRHMGWLSAFLSFHPWLYWLALAVVTATVAPGLRRPQTKKICIAFFVFHAIAGVALLLRPLLANLQNNIASFLWGLAALIPLLWLAVIDWVGHGDEVEWGESDGGEDRHVFRTALLTALFLWALYLCIFQFRLFRGEAVGLSGSEKLVAATWSALSHLLVFMALFVALNLFRALAKLFRTPAKIEFILCNLLIGASIALAVRHVVLAGVSFTGGLADLFSVAIGLSFAAFLAGLSLRLFRAEEGTVTSGLALTLLPLTLSRNSAVLTRALQAAVVAALAGMLAVRTAVNDWNFLVQKLSALAIWLAAFASFYAMRPRLEKKRDVTVILVAVAALTLGSYKTLGALQPFTPALLKNDKLDVDATLARYAGFDASFKVLHDLLTPPVTDASFYKFLQGNTNIPRTTSVAPVEVNLAPGPVTSVPDKPNIFIFTIDSLRQDYLSPYNKTVNFTPAIEEFARDSVVMENAFTRYGATGLSEPSIWVGGMLLHKQYITPFHPMNALQKLLEAEAYQSFISMDTILSVVVKPSPSIVELDRGAADKDFEFCRSLKELQARLDERQDPARPAFAYSQPQNVHISVINREGNSAPAGEEYPGFHAPYAARVKRIDSCFGEFVAHLKKRGLYEKSIIILTADHGDSLGEEGRWGHAYTIFPEVIRIPLIIHLPPGLQKGLVWDTKAVTFSTDITPSLYYLLGHRPIARNEIFGRPLFTLTAEEQAGYLQQSYLIASSYGAVYGILSQNGQSLYIADGINYADYSYDLTGGGVGGRNRVTSSVKSENEKLIRERILAINRFYNFGQGQ